MRFFLVVSLLYPLIFSVALAKPNTLASPLKQIQTLRDSGRLDKAIQIGQHYLNAKPSNLDTDVALVVGLMFLQKKDYTAAETYLNQVLKISPHYLEAEIALIQIRIAQRRPKEAQKLIQKVVQQAPHDSRVIKIQQDFKLSEIAEKNRHLKQIQSKRSH